MEILDKSQKGDSIIISELSRLGRSMLECMEILSIASRKDINIYAIKGNWQFDNSMQSKMMAMCFTIAQKLKESLILNELKKHS